MTNDGFRLTGLIHWKHFDKDGNLLDEDIIHNQIQQLLLDSVINAIEDNTFTQDVNTMAVGTGTGQAVADIALSSVLSYETSAGSHYAESQPTSAKYQLICTFSGMAANTITEAGLFADATGVAEMLAYNDGLSVSIGGTSDSLQITWTITASQ